MNSDTVEITAGGISIFDARTKLEVITSSVITNDWFIAKNFNNKLFKYENNDIVLNKFSLPVVNIGINISTEKEYYIVGEEFDPTTIVVSLLKSDNSVVKLNQSEYELTHFFNQNVEGEYDIIAKFEAFEDGVIVKVVNYQRLSVSLIDVDTLFLTGESFNLKKLVVRAFLSETKSIILNETEYNLDISNFNSGVEGKYEITITFASFSFKYDVVVVDKQVEVLGVGVTIIVDQTGSFQGGLTPVLNRIGDALTLIKKSELNADTLKVVKIKNGTYFEKLTISNIPNLTLIGEDRKLTVITYDAASDLEKPTGGTWGTQGSATVTISSGSTGLIVSNLTVKNSFDFDNSTINNKQAVALVNEADQSLFYQVDFIGVQDTLYSKRGRQHYLEVYVEGAVDFIFGYGGAVFFENSEIKSVARADNNTGVIATNYGYNETGQVLDYGFIFYHCQFTSYDDVLAGSVHLGRPWKPEATIAYINNIFGNHINPEGWTVMSGNQPENANFYEHGNKQADGVTDFGKTEKGQLLADELVPNYIDKDIVFGTINGLQTFEIAFEYSTALGRVQAIFF